MPQPIATQLGTFTTTGAGTPRVGQVGDHTFTATVSGVGAVSATVLIEASNDNVGWTTLATLSPSGTAVGAAAASSTSSYAYWRTTVSALTGTSVTVSAATEQVTDASQLTSQQKSSLLSAAGILQVPRILHCSTDITSSSDTAAGTANALASFILPAGIMGANGLLRFTFVCKGLDSLGAKNIRIWANSTQLFALASGSLNTNVLIQHQALWFNGGAEGSQNTYYNQPTTYGTVSATIGNTGINTALQQTIYLTADSATAAGPTVSKYLFMCELLRNQ